MTSSRSSDTIELQASPLHGEHLPTAEDSLFIHYMSCANGRLHQLAASKLFPALLEKEEVDGGTDGGAEDDGQDEEKEKRGVGAAAGGDDDGRALREVARVGFFGFGGLRLGGF